MRLALPVGQRRCLLEQVFRLFVATEAQLHVAESLRETRKKNRFVFQITQPFDAGVQHFANRDLSPQALARIRRFEEAFEKPRGALCCS